MQARNEPPNDPARIHDSAFSPVEENTVLPGVERAIAARLDTIAQTLFTVGLIADVLPRLWERDPREGRVRLAELRRLSLAALADVRNLLADLRKNGLDDEGTDTVAGKKEP